MPRAPPCGRPLDGPAPGLPLTGSGIPHSGLLFDVWPWTFDDDDDDDEDDDDDYDDDDDLAVDAWMIVICSSFCVFLILV